MRRLVLAVLIPISVLSLNWAASASAATGDAAGLPPTSGDGAVFAFGSAAFHGSVPGDPSIHLGAPIVGIAPDIARSGYWLVGSDGGVFGFGDALYHGSVPGSPSIHLAAPIIGMAATPDGGPGRLEPQGATRSTWERRSLGSPPPLTAVGTGWSARTAACSASVTPVPRSVPGTHSIHLGAPIVGIATADGGGYWLVGSDGGVFGFGDAGYHGSVPGSHSTTWERRSSAWPPPPTAVGTGWSARTAACSASVTPDTTGASRGATRSTWPSRLSGSPPTLPAEPGIGLPAAEPPASPSNCRSARSSVGARVDGAACACIARAPDRARLPARAGHGTFGDSTQQAVYALQKAAGIGRDGTVGPTTRAALSEGVVPHPRSTAGYVIEVDLEADLVMFVNNGKLEYTLNTSTGGGYQYSNGSGGTDIATTPTGIFQTYREVDGLVTDYLGQLWMPKFFTGGIAIHGDSYVPPEPVSHGCVRVSDEAIEWIWAANLDPLGTTVWVY